MQAICSWGQNKQKMQKGTRQNFFFETCHFGIDWSLQFKKRGKESLMEKKFFERIESVLENQNYW